MVPLASQLNSSFQQHDLHPAVYLSRGKLLDWKLTGAAFSDSMDIQVQEQMEVVEQAYDVLAWQAAVVKTSAQLAKNVMVCKNSQVAPIEMWALSRAKKIWNTEVTVMNSLTLEPNIQRLAEQTVNLRNQVVRRDCNEKGYSEPFDMATDTEILVKWATECTAGRVQIVWEEISNRVTSKLEQGVELRNIRALMDVVGTVKLQSYSNEVVRQYRELSVQGYQAYTPLVHIAARHEMVEGICTQVCAYIWCTAQVEPFTPCTSNGVHVSGIERFKVACCKDHYQRAKRMMAVDMAVDASSIFDSPNMFQGAPIEGTWKQSEVRSKMLDAATESHKPELKQQAWIEWVKFSKFVRSSPFLQQKDWDAFDKAESYLEHRMQNGRISALQAVAELWVIDRRHQELGLYNPFTTNNQVHDLVKKVMLKEVPSMELSTRRQELFEHELSEPETSAGQQGTQNLTENLTAPQLVTELASVVHMCAESLTDEDAEAVGAAGSVSRKVEYVKTVQDLIENALLDIPEASSTSRQ